MKDAAETREYRLSRIHAALRKEPLDGVNEVISAYKPARDHRQVANFAPDNNPA